MKRCNVDQGLTKNLAGGRS